jgi:hypothetical protein
MRIGTLSKGGEELGVSRSDGARSTTSLLGCILLGVFVSSIANGASSNTQISFKMVRSATVDAAHCLPNAGADVTDQSSGPVETLTVKVHGLPANTEFDFFVIQVPNGPFGLSWYQGDLQTGSDGSGQGVFVGRFSIETFIVAPGVAPAPVVHNNPPNPDASSNPATKPVHTFHLGLWFNAPADAVKAGCPSGVTPFNGDHNAGVQVLSTRNFPADDGPLRTLAP